MLKLTFVVECVHLFLGSVFVASMRKRGRIVLCNSSVLFVVALILNQVEGEVKCGHISSVWLFKFEFGG